jgi:hypothetical protein
MAGKAFSRSKSAIMCVKLGNFADFSLAQSQRTFLFPKKNRARQRKRYLN